MYIALRSSSNDFEQLRRALPEPMREKFDELVDIATTVQGNTGMTPREMDLEGVRTTVLVPRSVALQLQQ